MKNYVYHNFPEQNDIGQVLTKVVETRTRAITYMTVHIDAIGRDV